MFTWNEGVYGGGLTVKGAMAVFHTATSRPHQTAAGDCGGRAGGGRAGDQLADGLQFELEDVLTISAEMDTAETDGAAAPGEDDAG